MLVYNFLLPRVGGLVGGWLGGLVGAWVWLDTDNKANLSPVSLRYAANGAVAELGNILIQNTTSYNHYMNGMVFLIERSADLSD